jgi:CDP-6-deoxy-D-xylo-4-hexulose-3-dehydrase
MGINNSIYEDFAVEIFKRSHRGTTFVPGVSPIPVTGKVFDEKEIALGAEALGDFWLTSGRFTEQFERGLSTRVGVRHALMVNSGSSANLLAVSALTSKRLLERRILPGDEIITVAAGFPTTVAPIIQVGAVPVFVDVEIPTYVALPQSIEDAITPKTKAIFMAHTLGNPFDMKNVQELCKRHNLWLIEDSCDALGGTYSQQALGSFGDISTLSFYPAHHITTGEGGAVLTNRAKLKPIIESFRDWGRDCWCPSGHNDTCNKRFQWQLGDLPFGYDHKYTYSELGYNLKSGDIQAAIGVAQLEKLDSFIAKRKENWNYLKQNLANLSDKIILPEATPNSDPSWFGFAMTIRPESKIRRENIITFLDEKKIDTRLLFGGNLTKQPAFKSQNFRIVGNLENTDRIMQHTFWIGVWPGLSKQMLDYMIENIQQVMKNS